MENDTLQITHVDTISIDALFNFLDELKTDGYKIDVRHYIVLSDLVAYFISQGEDLKSGDNLKIWIAPIVCSTPLEQEDFYRRFDNKWKKYSADKSGSKPSAQQTKYNKNSNQKTNALPKRLILLLVLLLLSFFTILAFSTLLILYIDQTSFTLPKIIPSTNPINLTLPIISSNIIILAVILVFGFLAGIYFLYLYRQNQYLVHQQSKKISSVDRLNISKSVNEIMPTLFFGIIAKGLRQRISILSNEIDIENTLTRSIQQGGWLSFVYHQRQIIPEYVVLIQRQSYSDQQMRFVQEMLERLKNNNVLIHAFEFESSPQNCFSLDKKQFFWKLTDIQARYPDARLIVFTDSDALINPITGQLKLWLYSFSNQIKRTIFTFLDEKDPAIENLLSLNFSTLPFGINGLSKFIEIVHKDQATAIGRDNSVPDILLPDMLIDHPTIKLNGKMPPPNLNVSELLDVLKGYLKQKGFYWLCACAIYPELKWEITVFLGDKLFGKSQKKIVNDTLLRLVHLPWFRTGYMPDWLRLTLINQLPEEQENKIRQILNDWLSDTSPGWKKGSSYFEIAHQNSIFTQFNKFIGAITGSYIDDDNELNDHVFLNFMLNKPNPLVLRAPDAFISVNENVGKQRPIDTSQDQFIQTLRKGLKFIVPGFFSFTTRLMQSCADIVDSSASALTTVLPNISFQRILYFLSLISVGAYTLFVGALLPLQSDVFSPSKILQSWGLTPPILFGILIFFSIMLFLINIDSISDENPSFLNRIILFVSAVVLLLSIAVLGLNTIKFSGVIGSLLYTNAKLALDILAIFMFLLLFDGLIIPVSILASLLLLIMRLLVIIFIFLKNIFRVLLRISESGFGNNNEA